MKWYRNGTHLSLGENSEILHPVWKWCAIYARRPPRPCRGARAGQRRSRLPRRTSGMNISDIQRMVDNLRTFSTYTKNLTDHVCGKDAGILRDANDSAGIVQEIIRRGRVGSPAHPKRKPCAFVLIAGGGLGFRERFHRLRATPTNAAALIGLIEFDYDVVRRPTKAEESASGAARRSTHTRWDQND